jgi:hypothetical protein
MCSRLVEAEAKLSGKDVADVGCRFTRFFVSPMLKRCRSEGLHSKRAIRVTETTFLYLDPNRFQCWKRHEIVFGS